MRERQAKRTATPAQCARALAIWAGAFALALIASVQSAKAETVTGVSPARGSHSASSTANLEATFSGDMNAPDAAKFAVFRILGKYTGGTYSGGGTATLTLDPTPAFFPGEIVTSSLTSGLTSTPGGSPLNPASVWQYRVAATGGAAQFTDYATPFADNSLIYRSCAVGDLSGDGDLDVALGVEDNQNKFYNNNGSGTLTAGSPFGTGTDKTYLVRFGDINNDGALDIAVVNYQQQSRVYLNNGTGGFGIGSYRNFGSATAKSSGLAFGDLNGDGFLDIAVANYQEQNYVYLNDGAGNLTTESPYGTGSDASTSVVIGDMNGDGFLDAAIANGAQQSPNGQNYVYLNDGSGGLYDARAFGADDTQTYGVDVGDIDNDNDLDIVTGNRSLQQNTSFLNDGAGNFSSGPDIGSGGDNTNAVLLGDYDADGFLDVAVANLLQQNVVYLNGGGNFAGGTRNFDAAASDTTCVAAGDLDGDGSLDLTSVNQSGSSRALAMLNKTPANTLQFSASNFNVSEGVVTATVTVTRTGGSTGAVSVQWAATAGTASDGVDFTAATGALNWASGDAAAKTFTVAITEDLDVESNETIDIALSSPTGGATLGTPVNATITILDNDTEPTVQFAAATLDHDEDGGQASLTVTLSNPSPVPVSVNYATSDGTAVAGSDYTAESQVLTFDPGQFERTIDIAVTNDAFVEGDETFIVTIANPTNATMGGQTVMTVTLVDDDEPPTAQFALTGSNFNEANGAVTVTVTLNAPSDGTISVDWATSDGTATAAQDYVAASGTVNFALNETSATFDVDILGDLTDEVNETVTLTLSNPVNCTVGTPGTRTITIMDDDAAPTVRFSFSNVDFTEGAGSATITVSLSAVSGQQVQVHYASSNGTATAGQDYTSVNANLIFTPGQLTKTFPVVVLDDAIAEPSETVNLTLTSPQNATLGSPSTSTLTILDTDPQPSVEFLATNFDVSEAAGSGNLLVRLSASSGQTVTVTYAISGGTASAPADYATFGGVLTFTPGITERPIPVTIVNDTDDEGNETIEVTLSAPSNATLGAQNPSTMTILDNDTTPSVQFAAATYSFAEGAGTVNAVVSLSNPAGSVVSVVCNSSNGTATAPADYTAVTSLLVEFQPGVLTRNVAIMLANDTLDEDDETLTLTLTTPSGATMGAQNTTVVTITDNDDPPTVSFTLASVSHSENGGAASIEVKLNTASGRTVDVDWATSDGTAIQPGDYTAANGTVSFTPGQTTQTFDVTPVDDADIEGSETVNLTLTNPVNATLGSTATSTLTILDDDTPLEVEFFSANLNVNEGVSTGTVNVMVSLSAAASGTVTVDYATSDNTATAPDDYTATSGQLTFTTGQTSRTFEITLINDTTGEANELINVTLSNPVGAALGAQSAATITIVDNDTPSVRFNGPTYSALESAGTATITVTLSNASAQTVSVNYATSNGTATAGADYTATSGQLDFAPLELSRTFDISVTNDGSAESNETVVLTLSSPVNAALGAQSSATFTILDDDTMPEIRYSLANYTAAENVAGGTATITVTLSVSSALTVSVTYAAGEGTALDPEDFTAVSDVLTFTPGQTSRTFQVTIIDDALDELDETVALSLSAPSNGVLGAQNTAMLTMTDDDAQPSVKLAAANTNFTEAAGNAQITAELSTVSGRDVTVNYATSNGTASAGADYTAASGTVTFTAGETSKTFNVPVLHDGLIEGNETVNLTLSAPSGATLGSPSTGTLTIVDNDGTPAVRFSASTASIVENAGSVELTVTLSAPSALTVTANYATANGTAVAGDDYTTESDVVTFLPGETSQTIDIDIIDDGTAESSQNFTVTLSAPSNCTLGSPATATVTILDDDDLPTVTFALAAIDIGEGGNGLVSVQVTLSHSSTLTVKADYATADGTAIAGSDYTTKTDTLTFTPGQTSKTFDVPILADALVEGDEDFTITLSNLIFCTAGANQTTTVTIEDDDALGAANIAFASVDVPEAGGTISVTVTLSVAPGAEATVDYSVTGGTAGADDDYEFDADTLTFDVGETSQSFDIEIIDDGAHENTETIIVTISNPSGCTIGVQASATIRITDDDPEAPAAPPVFASLVVVAPDNVFRTGETVELLATLDAPGLTVTADLEAIDDAMDNDAAFIDNGDSTYSLISPPLVSGSLNQGLNIPVNVTASAAGGSETVMPVLITIDKTAPSGALTYNLPSDAVPEGDLIITLTYNEPLEDVPEISISGLGGGLDIDDEPMDGDAGGVSFTYVYTIPPATTGDADVSIGNAGDIAGNAANAPSGASFTVVGGAPTLVADAGPDQIFTKLKKVTLDASPSTGATSFLWTQASGPNVTLTGASGLNPTFTPGTSGDYAFKLKVSASGANAYDIVVISIPNLVPTANAGADIYLDASDVITQSGQKYTRLGLAGSALDPNGDTLYVSWMLAGGPDNGNLTIDTPSQLTSKLKVSGSLVVGGVYTYRLAVADPALQGEGNPAIDTVRVVVVSPTVVPPSAHAGMDQIVAVGATVQLTANESSDPDADDPSDPNLDYAWEFVSKPAGSSASLSNPSIKLPTFDPDEPGVYVLELVVTDEEGLESGADRVRITANDEGGSPNRLARAIISKTFSDSNSNGAINTGETVTLSGADSLDGDSDPLTYSWEQLSGPATVVFDDPDAEEVTFSTSTRGTYSFRLSVDDGEDEGIPAEISIIVASGALQGPGAIANIATADDSDDDGYVLFIPGTGTNNDAGNPSIDMTGAASTGDAGVTKTYRWTQIRGPTVGIVGANQAVASFKPLISRVYEFELTVTDANGLFDTTILRVAVDTYHATAYPDGNSVPRVDPQDEIEANAGQLITLSASGDDPDGDDLIYIWVQTAGPPVVLDLTDPEHPTFTAPIAATYAFDLYIDDGNDISLASPVIVSVGGSHGFGGGEDEGGSGGGAAADARSWAA